MSMILKLNVISQIPITFEHSPWKIKTNIEVTESNFGRGKIILN